MSGMLKMEDLQEVSTSEAKETTPVVDEQDPLKGELEKVTRTGRTEAEKAAFSLKKNAERARELGIDPAEVLGLSVEKPVESIDNDDDAPVTIGMLKRFQQEGAKKTALQMAEEIQSESERELTKYYLENRIVPSGNPTQDLADARELVNAKKNARILEEAARKTPAKQFSSASSAPARHEEPVEFTKDEITLMKFGGLTKEEVLAARNR